MPLPTTGLTGHWNASTNEDVFTTNNAGGNPTGNCADGEDANVWRSKVNSAHLMRAITGHGTIPVWKNDSAMLHPSVLFDKTNVHSNGGSRCEDSNGTFISPAVFVNVDAYTILVSFRPQRADAADTTVLTTTWSSYNALIKPNGAGFQSGAKGYDTNFDTVYTPDVLDLNTSHVLRIRKDATTMYASVDGGAEVSVPHGNVGDLTYGGSGSYGLFLAHAVAIHSSSLAYSGRIGEVAIYNTFLTGGDLTQATNHFTSRWLESSATTFNALNV